MRDEPAAQINDLLAVEVHIFLLARPLYENARREVKKLSLPIPPLFLL